MSKIGMNLMLWTDSIKLEKDEALMEKVMGMGFDGIEVPVHAGMTVADAEKLGKWAKEKGYPLIALGVMDKGNTISSDAAEREEGVKTVRYHIDCAVALGSDILIGPYTQQLGYFSGERLTAQEREWSLEGARKIADYAKEKGIRIAIEPLNRFEQLVLNTAKDAVQYIKDLGRDNVGLLMDTMHMNIEELNVAKALEYAMPYTFHIHISENDRGIPGTGHACGADVFEVIKRAGFNGWLSIEAFNEGAPSLQGPLHLWRNFAPSDDALAEQGLAYIREMLK